jgi:zinc/manganese transport system permease protein
MKETLLFLSTPLAASILLAGLLGYFGTHILARGIIFIDIALTQIASLGIMIGLLIGFAEESVKIQLLSYAFTLLIAGSFAFLKTKGLFIPLEAVIGIVYCIGLALALLLAEYLPGGSIYITKSISGNILWVTWKKVLNLALLFVGLVGLHVLFGNTYTRLSGNGTGGPDMRTGDRLVNLLFYSTFGIIVVKAVMIGGIFLVFTLLIAPSVAAGLYVKSWKARLAWSWIIGGTGAMAGILLSYYLNLPNGPVIVCLLGLVVIGLALLKLLKPV